MFKLYLIYFLWFIRLIKDLLSQRLVPDISVEVLGRPWILGQSLCRKRYEWYWGRIQTANKGIVFVGCVQVFNKSQISKGYQGNVFVLPESVPPSGNYARQKHLKRETKRPVAK